MVAFTWIYTFFFLVLVLQFTVTVQTLKSFNVTVGVSVQLPCKSLTDDQCKSVTWLLSHSDNTTTLFEDGKIRANSDQLYVASDCSLNIKTVSLEDAGLYTCRQFRSGQQHGEDTVYDLSVVDSKDTKPGTIKPTTTTTIKSTSKRTSTSKTTTTTTKATSTKARTNTSATATNDPPTKQVWRWWWWVIIASVGSAVLIITAAVLIRWKRAKGKRTPMDENMADPADGVCYASISYSKTTNSNVQVQDKDDDDEDDAVTYSTVKASSSSAGASADPSDLYATVIKPKR
ncbi:uncharacterized protein LOC125896887 [Epinephelus fuscoguttatus]|uniref:uncharacterized protein LOC125896887 n=1 Tax=Epinephelus fuscoguttatus TaxID=293821 RepID=UPI0020D0A70A|nr:uncharacterized protein LOC125896887 [Epinephelus fuscoguttatus]